MRFARLGLCLCALAVSPVGAESITWVTSAPPLPQSAETQDSAQLAFLTSHLPAFSQHVVHVSAARAYHELEHGSGVCKVGVLLTPERQHYAVFAARHMVLPGYHIVVRKERIPALVPAMVKGEVDLDKLAALSNVAGGYTHVRHYDASIADFTQAHDGASVTSVVSTNLLFNLMQAERLDYSFILPMDLYFYADEVARQKLVLLPIKGITAWTEGGIACSSDQSGKNLIRALDSLLADDSRWAEFIEPMRKWIPPESYPTLLAGHPASSNVNGVP